MTKQAWGIWGVALALTSAMVACQQTEEAFQDRKTRENRDQIRQYVATLGLRVDSTRNGLFYSVQNRFPNGQKPQIGDEISIRYVARRLDGVLVDSTSSTSPYSYIRVPGTNSTLYSFQSVPSFEDLLTTGVEKVREGDRVSLFVPWSLRSTSVAVSLLAPLYIPLRYELEIVNVRPEWEQIRDMIVRRKLPSMELNADSLRFVRTLAQPDSAQVKVGDVVKVRYTGRFASNDNIFDSNTSTGIEMTVADPTTANRGGGVVKGFNDGVAKLKYGEKAIVIFPSVLGYGTTGRSPSIPAYAPLYFELELVRK
jgi:FKBP-type peptidyl-prolyl cis-trans isomerase